MQLLMEEVIDQNKLASIQKQNQSLRNGSSQNVQHALKGQLYNTIKDATDEMGVRIQYNYWDVFYQTELLRAKYILDTNDINPFFLNRLMETIKEKCLNKFNLGMISIFINSKDNKINIIIWI